MYQLGMATPPIPISPIWELLFIVGVIIGPFVFYNRTVVFKWFVKWTVILMWPFLTAHWKRRAELYLGLPVDGPFGLQVYVHRHLVDRANHFKDRQSFTVSILQRHSEHKSATYGAVSYTHLRAHET